MSDQRSYFVRVDDRTFRATELTAGAWSTTEQHISPMMGLVVHAIDEHVAERSRASGARDQMVLSRLSVDILGVVGIDEFDLHVETIRPGRTVELLEAVVTWRGRAVVRARAWRVLAFDTSQIAGGAPEPMPHPDSISASDDPLLNLTWPGEFIASVEARYVESPEPGRGRAWLRSDVRLVAEEEVGPVADFLKLVDVSNGIAVRASPKEWLFPNLDLTLHLHRQPAGEWLGFDTEVMFGSSGQGLTSSVLHDADGPVGRVEQSLTIRPNG
ncbi:MAG: thioesterase family protein [Nocardioides sp.]|nr:thioesterase family protein [Nocardioides sp.]